MLKKVMWDETGHRLPQTVAISPQKLALTAGFEIPEDRKFIAVTGGGINEIGKEFFFSSEKLTTLLSLFKYEGEFENALTMMQAIFNVGGKGHSCVSTPSMMSISTDSAWLHLYPVSWSASQTTRATPVPLQTECLRHLPWAAEHGAEISFPRTLH